MRLLILLLVSVIPFFTGRRTADVHVYLEDSTGTALLAYQKTGNIGEVAFKYLDGGSYQLSVELPQQEGKYIKEKQRHQTITKATFNIKTRTYYYKGDEGFYSVKIKKSKKIDKESFSAVFKEHRTEDENLYTIAKFLIKSDGGELGLVVRAITAKQFKRATEKIGNDISMISIPGTK